MSRSSNGTSTNYLSSSSAGPLSGSAGPWTVAFWMSAANLTQTNTYLFQTYSNVSTTPQAAVIFGFVTGKVEFYSNVATGADPRTGSQITIPDTGWHHVCYRKAASGSSAYDRFLDGTKTQINSSTAFTFSGTFGLTSLLAAQTFSSAPAAGHAGALAEVMIDTTAWSDAQILALAQGSPARLTATAAPAFLWELRGKLSPEPESSNPALNLTVNGTVPAGTTPPVRYQAFGAMGLLGVGS